MTYTGFSPPNERRNFVHKRIFKAATGFVTGGFQGAAIGFVTGGSKRRGKTPRASDRVSILPISSRMQRRSGPGFADSAGCASTGGVQLRRKFPGGPCENPFAPSRVTNGLPMQAFQVTDVPGIRGAAQRFFPGGATGREIVTTGGAPGAAPPGLNALVPEGIPGTRLRCPRRYVLGIDDLCYFNLPRNSKWRKWRPGRKPMFTAGDLNSIRRVSKLSDSAEEIFEATNPSKKAVARNYRSNWRKPLKK